jgi:hypothetical protein
MNNPMTRRQSPDHRVPSAAVVAPSRSGDEREMQGSGPRGVGEGLVRPAVRVVAAQTPLFAHAHTRVP